MTKRKKDILNLDDYFMGMAFVVAAGSPAKQQGAVFVENDQIISISHDSFAAQETHAVHAELQAILKCSSAGYNAFLTHTPCYNCVMALVLSKMERLVYFETKKLDDQSEDILNYSSIEVIQFKGNLNWMRDYLNSLKSQDIFV